jgi:hypothetical protein
MELLFKLLMAILVISIILILLDRSVFTFIEDNLPYINEIEKQHKNESKKEGMTSVEEEQRQMDEQQVESVTSADPNKDLSYSYESSFCRVGDNDLDDINKRCKKLNSKKCKTVDCCVLLNGAKCVAGNKQGPSFEDDKSTAGDDYYYFKNKCYGKCPK